MWTFLIIMAALIAIMTVMIRRRPAPDPTKKPRERGEYVQLIIEKWPKIHWWFHGVVIVIALSLPFIGGGIGSRSDSWNCEWNPKTCGVSGNAVPVTFSIIGAIVCLVLIVGTIVLELFMRALRDTSGDRD